MKILDPDQVFRLGDLLLPKSKRATAIRFLVAARYLAGLSRSLLFVVESGHVRDYESREVLLLQMAGAAKEAADCFRSCDAEGVFREFENGGDAFDQFRGELKVLRDASCKANKESLYCRVLKPYRDMMGFHINRAAIDDAITALEDDRFKAAELDDREQIVSIPLVRSIMVVATWGKGRSPAAMARDLDELFQYEKAVQAVAHDYFLLLVRVSTMEEDPS